MGKKISNSDLFEEISKTMKDKTVRNTQMGFTTDAIKAEHNQGQSMYSLNDNSTSLGTYANLGRLESANLLPSK